MRLPGSKGLAVAAATLAAFLLPGTAAERMLVSSSLNQCDDSASSSFTATLFDVVFTPDNRTLSYNINAISSISSKVTAELNLFAYGYLAVNNTINPCTSADFSAMCPLNPGPIPLKSNSQLPQSVVDRFPSIAYSVPDIDVRIRVVLHDAQTYAQVACVEAVLSNGQTVDQEGVQWTTAIIAGLGLVASAVTSGLGHSNTAAHVAANALSLFGFFQSQAVVGMTSVEMPPIVQSWTQNFQWSMGIVRVGFMQTVCTWYQRATGGIPSTLLSNLSVQSVSVQKRSLEAAAHLVARGYGHLVKRQSGGSTSSPQAQEIVRGIERVGFRAGIEPTNIFLTGLGFFVAFIVAVALFVLLFKAVLELAARQGWMKSDKFQEFRSGWRIVLKGILFRIVLIGYSQMCILCLWELTVRDSAAEVVLSLFYFVAMTGTLVWAAFKVLRIARRSESLHQNPAYILYSDPTALNKWGFLYVQYRATAYYFIFPQLCYILFKALFIAFAQAAPVAQAVGLLIIEALWLIAVSILRPWMDKKTNTFNISIAVINFLNAIFLLIFSNVFNQPGLVSGIIGVVFTLMNAIFALVLLILVLIASVYAIVSKNPDTRYQPMRDDRGSFIKSQSNLNTELDALGATARGVDMKIERKNLDDETSSLSSARRAATDAAAVGGGGGGVGGLAPPSANNSQRNLNVGSPFLPADGQPRHNLPFGAGANGGAGGAGANGGAGRPAYNSGASAYSQQSRSMTSASPAPPQRFDGYVAGHGYERSGSLHSGSPRPGGGRSQWQRGAGYE